MGSRGPAPAPRSLQELKGVRPSRLRTGTPQPAVLSDLTPPKWFDLEARRFWRKNAPILAGNGLLTELDRIAFEVMCCTWSLWRSLSVRADEYEISSQEHKLIAGIRDRQATALLQQFKDFGMTPASRSRVTAVPVDEPVDEFETFLNRNRYEPADDPRHVLKGD